MAALESLAQGGGGERRESDSHVSMGQLSPRSWAREATANRRGSFIQRIVNRRGSRDVGSASRRALSLPSKPGSRAAGNSAGAGSGKEPLRETPRGGLLGFVRRMSRDLGQVERVST